jgi:hypothetical protein
VRQKNESPRSASQYHPRNSRSEWLPGCASGERFRGPLAVSATIHGGAAQGACFVDNMETVKDTPTRRDTCEGPLRAVKPNIAKASATPGTARLSARPGCQFIHLALCGYCSMQCWTLVAVPSQKSVFRHPGSMQVSHGWGMLSGRRVRTTGQPRQSPLPAGHPRGFPI